MTSPSNLFTVAVIACLTFATPMAHAEPEAKSPWIWHHEEGSSLALLHGDQTVWQWNYSADLAKPYFDPLALPGGGNLTWISPPDHVWHYGLWFSWKYINGVNYWEINPKSGKPDGTTRLRNTKILCTDKAGAEIQFDLEFHPAAGGDPVLKETVHLSIETPRADGSYTIDWHQLTSAPAHLDVTLDRTPPAGQPGGKDWGGYGGLSFRGAKDLADVTILDSEGRRDMAAHRNRARWIDTSGTIHGKQTGVTFFDHPANPGHPNLSYVALTPLKHGPFTYMNPALLHDAPITLHKGESLTLRYHILIHPGPAQPKELDAEFEKFTRSSRPDPKTP